MSAKKIIAVIASTQEKASAIVNRLSLDKTSLLLIAKHPGQFTELSTSVRSGHPDVELDVIDCMKDGCWEADIIALDIPYADEKEVAELIKEVSTQKIVVHFIENDGEIENDELQNLLKYSKVVRAFNSLNSSIISLYSKDVKAISEVSDILKCSEQISPQLI